MLIYWDSICMNIMKRFNSSLLLSFLCLLAITSCVSDSEEQEVSALEIATDPMYIEYFNNNTELIFDLKESLSIVDLENISLGELNHDDLSSLLQSDLFSSRDEIDSGISFQHSLMSQLDKKYNLSELPEQLIYHTLVEANRIILLENSKVKEKNGSCEVDYALCVAAAYAPGSSSDIGMCRTLGCAVCRSSFSYRSNSNSQM